MMSEHFQSIGATVTIKKDRLAGHPCHHLEVNRPDGYQDMFMLLRDGVQYGLLVTQPTRDEALIERAKKGLRLTEK